MLCSTLRATHHLLKLYPCSLLRFQVSINVPARQYRVQGNRGLNPDMVATLYSRLRAFRFKLEAKH